MSETDVKPRKLVREFRQILVWPLQLMPLREGALLAPAAGDDDGGHHGDQEQQNDPSHGVRIRRRG